MEGMEMTNRITKSSGFYVDPKAWDTVPNPRDPITMRRILQMTGRIVISVGAVILPAIREIAGRISTDGRLGFA